MRPRAPFIPVATLRTAALASSFVFTAIVSTAIVSTASAQRDAETQETDPSTGTATEVAQDVAQDGDARSHFRVGELMYGEGRFAEAAAEFDRAYALSGRSELLYNAYLAHRDAGRLPEATARLRAYLEATPDAESREALDQRLAAMEQTLAEQQRMAAMTEEERARALAEAEAHRQAAEREREARQRAEARRSPVPFIVMGSGAALLVGGLVTGIVARGRVSDIEDECPNNLCRSGFDLGSERRRARRMTISTDVLLSVGVATAATGAVLLILNRRRHATTSEAGAAPAAPSVTAGCTTTGCEANLQVSF